jgi:hypothetical protein
VVIGASRPQLLPAKVCEHTLRRHSIVPVDVIHTYDRPQNESPRIASMNRTGFSFVRFAVPELTNFEGRAVYLDSDMLVFKDIGRLFGRPMSEATVLRPPNQTAVLLYDCQRLRHWSLRDVLAKLESGEYVYKTLMETLYEPGLKVGIPDAWNSLEYYDKENTAVLHFTKMDLQPWTFARNPLRHLWYEALREAVAGGAISMEEVAAEAALGHVKEWVVDAARGRKIHA